MSADQVVSRNRRMVFLSLINFVNMCSMACKHAFASESAATMHQHQVSESVRGGQTCL